MSKNTKQIFIKNVPGLSLPKKSTPLSSGLDIVAMSEPEIVGEKWEEPIDSGWKRIDYIQYKTNLFIQPADTDVFSFVFPRSSISNYNLVLANSVGIIDTDYTNQILVRFKYIWQPEDFSKGSPNVEKIYKFGDRIAQLVFSESVNVNWQSVDDLKTTVRNLGGFGSTGK
jgi:deoxyuridine 5'-triphosphate nucleotidohydrolase